MIESKFKYTPEIPEVFRCRVPLPQTIQAFVTNGVLRERIDPCEGVSISASKGERGFDYVVNDDCQLSENVQIISFRDSADTEDLTFTNNLVFGSNTESNILLCTHTLTLDSFKTEEYVKIKVGSGARVNIVVMQNEHNNSEHTVNFDLNVESDAFIRINVVTLHGAILTNDFNVKLAGKGSVCELNGVYLVDGKQTIKTNVQMNHLVPDCISRQLFKGILDDESRATFTGRIVVAKDAQKTEAYQANHNLLISPSAKAYAQPQLEIYADDVKCSHGATSGRLDDNALFYMRSRGIGKQEAKLLQQLAFVYDVLENINNEQLRIRLSDLVESRLRGEFGHCTNCSMNCC